MSGVWILRRKRKRSDDHATTRVKWQRPCCVFVGNHKYRVRPLQSSRVSLNTLSKASGTRPCEHRAGGEARLLWSGTVQYRNLTVPGYNMYTVP